MIKSYKKFLESDLHSNISWESYLESFIECVIECEEYYSNQGFGQFSRSYSYTAQSGRTEYDPEEDFKKVDYYMTKHGFEISRVKEMVNNIHDFLNKIYRASISQCAAIDYYLYKITSHEFPLQGYEWEEADMASLDENEFLIKFKYGWHKTKYGRLIIEQNMESVENFLKTCVKYVPQQILIEIVESLLLSKKWPRGTNIIMFIKDLLKFFLFEQGDKDIYLDSIQLLEGLNNKIDDLNMSQSELNKLVIESCRKTNLGINARLIGKGDIKINIDRFSNPS